MAQLGKQLGTRLGKTLGTDLAGSALTTLRALAAGMYFFSPHAYSVDGITGKPANYIDQTNIAHTVTQLTSAQQSALPSVSGNFGTQPSAAWNTGGAGFVFYDSNGLPSTQRYLHGAQGGSLQLDVFKQPTGAVFRAAHVNRTSAATGTVVYARINVAGQCRAETYAGATPITGVAGAGSDEASSYITYLITDTAYALRYRGTLIGVGIPASAPSNTDSPIPLRIGSVTAAFGPLTGEWACCAAFPPATSVSQVQSLVQQIWGIAA